MTDTKNQNLPIKQYQKEFKGILGAVFETRAYFRDFFVGDTIEALDGVSQNKTAFTVKTSNIPVTVGETYSTSKEDVAFGTGTGNTTRFGNRTEIIYTDVDVPYTWQWVFHEGIDIHTVNNDLDATIADRLEVQAIAKTDMFDKKHSKFIATCASKSIALDDYSNDKVAKLFNDMNKVFINNKAKGEKVAKVAPDLYNAIVDHPLSNKGKGSSVNIDNNEVLKFKGFIVEEVPHDLFQSGDICYAYVKHIAKAFTGINTTRTIPSEDFDGVALQGSGKAGEFIPGDNKKAVIKVTGTDVL